MRGNLIAELSIPEQLGDQNAIKNPIADDLASSCLIA
jgi:hypothetical protein